MRRLGLEEGVLFKPKLGYLGRLSLSVKSPLFFKRNMYLEGDPLECWADHSSTRQLLSLDVFFELLGQPNSRAQA